MIKKLSVFLSSPSDVSSERDMVVEVCNEIELDLGRIQCFSIELLRWEAHAGPGIDESAQQVINKKIGNNYNIFLGIFGKKFGTPTIKWRSGSEEEFRIAHERFQIDGLPKIMLYFSTSPIDPYRSDLNQIEMIRNFREEIAKLGVLYWTYSDPIQFKILLRRHLIDEITNLIKSELTTVEGYQPLVESKFDPLYSYNLVQSEDPLLGGYVLLQNGTKSMRATTKDLVAINNNMTQLSRATQHFGREMMRIQRESKLNQSKVSREVLKFIDSLQTYIDSFVSIIPSLRLHFESAISNQYRAISILKLSNNVSAGELDSIFGSLKSLIPSIDLAMTGIEGLNSSIEALPNIGSDFDLKRRLMISLNKDLLAFLSWSRITLVQAVAEFDSKTEISETVSN